MRWRIAAALVGLSLSAAAQEPWFRDVASQVGLSGAGTAAWGDCDGDGGLDLLRCGKLYENRGGADADPAGAVRDRPG